MLQILVFYSGWRQTILQSPWGKPSVSKEIAEDLKSVSPSNQREDAFVSCYKNKMAGVNSKSSPSWRCGDTTTTQRYTRSGEHCCGQISQFLPCIVATPWTSWQIMVVVVDMLLACSDCSWLSCSFSCLALLPPTPPPPPPPNHHLRRPVVPNVAIKHNKNLSYRDHSKLENVPLFLPIISSLYRPTSNLPTSHVSPNGISVLPTPLSIVLISLISC